MRFQPIAASDVSVVAAALLFSVSLGSAAHAQTPSEATQVIEAFGANGTLTRAQMTAYLSSVEFKKLDADKSGGLDADEYMSAQLYARLPTCVNDRARETWLEENKAGTVDSTQLYSGNPTWKTHVDEMTTAHWSRAATEKEQGSLNEAQLAKYLADERTRRNHVPTVAERLTSLMDGNTGDITIAQFNKFFLSEWFAKADADGSGTITFVEFTRVAAYLTAATEFCALAQADGVIVRADLEGTTMSTAAPALQVQLDRSVIRSRQAVSMMLPVPEATAKRVFEREAAAAAERAAAAEIGRRGFVPGRGFLIGGTRQLSAARELTWNQNAPAMFLRVIKDFTLDDPLKAEPALFTIQGEQNKETTFAIDSTFQVDFYPASFKVLRAGAGVDIERSTGNTASQVDTYYGTIHLFFWHASWLESSYFKLSPNVEDNRTKTLTTFAGDLLWQPGFRFGQFRTNQWRPLGSAAFWYVTPRVALELGEVVRTPEGSDEPDITNARLEIISGLRIGPRFTTTYRALRRFAFGESADNSDYQELAVRWSFDEYDRFSLKVGIADGRKTTAADDKGTFSLGIGVKF